MASRDFTAELIQTARALAAPGKGILAADESTGTIGKHLESIGVENTLENRKAYRTLLFTTEGLGEYISGAITYEETLLGDSDVEGKSMVDLLTDQGIIPGIKVDKGAVPLYGTDNETVTQGLTNLAQRAKRYYEAGARFAKWRAIINISDSGAPSQLAIDQNAHSLARYAKICQAQGLVPIVEPEVLMDGTHNIERAAVVTEAVQAAVVKALSDHHVLLEGALLKPNMVRQGSECQEKCSPAAIAQATVRVLQHTMPPALAGVNFLSGGMSEEFATVCLNAMNAMELGPRPWVRAGVGVHVVLRTVCVAGSVRVSRALHLARARAHTAIELNSQSASPVRLSRDCPTWHAPTTPTHTHACFARSQQRLVLC